MRVLKFGGILVVNVERFLRVVDILESNVRQGQVVIVFFVFVKIINYLVAMIEKIISGQDVLFNISDVERIFVEFLTGFVVVQSGFSLA